MSYSSFINAIHIVDNFFGPSLASASDSAPALAPAGENNEISAVGSLDNWKVTWRKEGAEFGKLTIGLGCGCIMAFSSLPMSALMGGIGFVGQVAQIAVPVALPDYLGKPLYALGAWAGQHIGYQVGWYGGALAAETFELLENVFNKLSQLANTLYAEIMRRLGYSLASDAVTPEPPPSPPIPLTSPSSPSSTPLEADGEVLLMDQDLQPSHATLQPSGQAEGSVQREDGQEEDEHVPDNGSASSSLPLNAVNGLEDLPIQQDSRSSLSVAPIRVA